MEDLAVMAPDERLALGIVCRDHPTRTLGRQCLDTGADNYLQPFIEGGMVEQTWTTGYNTPDFRFYEHIRACSRHKPARTNELQVDRLIYVLRAVSTVRPAPHTWRVTDLDLSRLLGLMDDGWDADRIALALDALDTRRRDLVHDTTIT